MRSGGDPVRAAFFPPRSILSGGLAGGCRPLAQVSASPLSTPARGFSHARNRPRSFLTTSRAVPFRIAIQRRPGVSWRNTVPFFFFFFFVVLFHRQLCPFVAGAFPSINSSTSLHRSPLRGVFPIFSRLSFNCLPPQKQYPRGNQNFPARIPGHRIVSGKRVILSVTSIDCSFLKDVGGCPPSCLFAPALYVKSPLFDRAASPGRPSPGRHSPLPPPLVRAARQAQSTIPPFFFRAGRRLGTLLQMVPLLPRAARKTPPAFPEAVPRGRPRRIWFWCC